MKLARAVYVSRCRPDVSLWQATAEIVGASYARNTRDDLTGVLLCHDGWFVQVLEGLPERVRRLLDRIATDPRHTDMAVVDFTPCMERRFGAWAMAHVVLAPEAVKSRGAFDPSGMSAGELLGLLDTAHAAASQPGG